jgi:hypothetical protein
MTRLVVRCGEGFLYLCGLVALAVVVRHIGVLVEYVTIGPLAIPLRGSSHGWAVFFLFEDLGLAGFFTGDAALLAGFVLACSGAVLATRLRRTRNANIATVVFQATVSLSVLAYSYRFAGLIAVVCVIGWQLARHTVGRMRWLAWGAAVALCFAPYDISCRNFEGPAHFETRIHCASEAALQEYAANRKVCVGSDAAIYNEPAGVWVW